MIFNYYCHYLGQTAPLPSRVQLNQQEQQQQGNQQQTSEQQQTMQPAVEIEIRPEQTL